VDFFPFQLTQDSLFGKRWQTILKHEPGAVLVRFRIMVSELLFDGCDLASVVDRDIERRVFALLVPCSRTTADFADKVLAFLSEVCEEEEILAMAFGEGVPDLPRFSGLVAKEGAISNRNIDGGEEIRVSDFFIKIESNQFLIIGVESITMRHLWGYRFWVL